MKRCDKRNILYRQWGCTCPKAAMLLIHGLGGLISFLTVIKKPKLFKGLICISPGFASHLKFSLMENDQFEHRFATPKLLQSILLGQLSSRLLKYKVRTDTLFLLAGDDRFVKADVSRKIFKGIKFEHKVIVEYPEMRHSLIMELGREKVFSDLLKWAQKRI